MARRTASSPKPSTAAMPDEPWAGVPAWIGTPPKPAPGLKTCPKDATFIGVELQYTLLRPKGPDLPFMFETTWEKRPGILRLEGGKPVEFHTRGWNGRCWTYRRAKEGRRLRWRRWEGEAFPAAESADLEEAGQDRRVDQILVRSLLPLAGIGRYLCFVIRDDGGMEDLTRAVDPDPDDDVD